MKVASEIYKGIEYIQISALPHLQRNEIQKSLSDRLVIKILKDGSVLKDCVQYQHYEFWYENIFKKQLVQDEKVIVEETPINSLALVASGN